MEEPTLKEKVDILYETNRPKTKKMRMPGKGKVSKSRQKKGYMTIVRIDDNKNIAFERQKMDEGAYRLKQGSYHTSNEQAIYSYKGKPLVFQATKKLNPWNPLGGDNQTYGQKLIMARMIGDTIKVKAKGASIIVIVAVIAAIIFGINYFSGGA